jgi:hypothetical protein
MNDDDETETLPPTNRLALIKRKLRRLGFMLGVLVIFWVISTQVLPRLMLPKQPVSAPAAQQVEAQEKSQTIEEKIEALGSKLEENEGPVTQTAPEELAQTVVDVPVAVASEVAVAPAPDTTQSELVLSREIHDERLAQLEATIKEQQAAVETLKTQLASAEAKSAEKLTVIASIGQIKEALARGESFVLPLGQLSLVARTREELLPLLETLAPYSNQGLPTLSELQNEFNKSAKTALGSDVQANVLSRVFSKLISIRKVGEATGTDDESIIARAEVRLERGEIDACLQELSTLNAQNAIAFSAWVQTASQRQKALRSLSALEQMIAHSTPVTSHD